MTHFENFKGGQTRRAARLRSAIGQWFESLEDRRLLAATLVNAPLLGTESSSPEHIIDANGTAIFTAGSGSKGLWRSDGTSLGTTLLGELPSGSVETAVVGSTTYVFAGGKLFRSGGVGGDLTLIKDTQTPSGFTSRLTRVGENLFFTVYSESTGTELWRSDGTGAGTVAVTGTQIGLPFQSINYLTDVNGEAYFVAIGAAHPAELWKSDGTTAGTTRVISASAPGAPEHPANLTAFDGQLYFTSTDGDGQLWKSDGTAAGTAPLRTDLKSIFIQYVFNGSLYFSATDNPAAPGVSSGNELWKSDGTPQGTVRVKDIATGSYSAYPEILGAAGNFVYFLASGANGRQLWRTDGTDAGTAPLPVTNFDSGVGFGNYFYFALRVSATDAELWRTDGTPEGTALFKDINPGPEGSRIGGLTNVSGQLYFSADDGFHGQELWTSDGTAAGTRLVKDIVTTPANLSISQATPFRGGLLYTNQGGYGLYCLTSTGEVEHLISARITQIAVNDDGSAYFTALDASGYATLSKTDGTFPGTVQIKRFDETRKGEIQSLSSVGNHAYLSGWAPGSSDASALWSSDGTTAGTRVVKDVATNGPIAIASSFVGVAGSVYFTAFDRAHGTELWKLNSDGATAAVVKDIYPGPGSGVQGKLYKLGDRVLFVGIDETSGFEIWSSDGTAAGTTLVKDVIPGGESGVGSGGSPEIAVTSEALYYLSPVPNSNSYTLYRTDGTSSGTVALKTFARGGSKLPYRLTAVGNSVYFANPAGDGSIYELWRSDGTPSTTRVVRTLQATSYSASPAIFNIVDAGGNAFFTAYDAVDNHGVELWTTDGTAAGTYRYADLSPGVGNSDPRGFAFSGGKLYFIANTVGNDRPLFSVVIPTSPPSAPTNLVAIAAGPLRIDLSWQDTSTAAQANEATGFKIERSRSANFATVDATFTAPIGATAYSDGDVEPETTYYYRVSAFNAHGTSPASASASASTPAIVRPQYKIVDPEGDYFAPSDGTTIVGFKHRAYFNATSYEHGLQLVRSDGLTVSPLFHTAVSALTVMGDSLYWLADHALWRSDGSVAGTRVVIRFDESTGLFQEPTTLTPFKGRLYFAAGDNTVYGRELWTSDGTTAGTFQLKDIADPAVSPGYDSSNPEGFLAVGDTLFFRAGEGIHGFELWKTDGTSAGTKLVKDLAPGPDGSVISSPMQAANGLVYFLGYSPGSNPEERHYALFRSDGTDSGTNLVYDNAVGGVAGFNGKTYFIARPIDVPYGAELWETDGSQLGSHKVRTIDGARYFPDQIFVIGNQFYFHDGFTLWASDGTSQGTRAIGSFDNGDSQRVISDVVSVGGKLYFRGGQSLWTSDGTPAGTVQVAPPAGVPAVVNPRSLAVSDGTLYFTAATVFEPPILPRLFELDVALAPPPAAPANLVATTISSVQINLNWTDASSNESGFTLERSLDASFSTIAKEFALDAGATSFADTGLAPGQTYYYRIRSFNEGGKSAFALSNAATTQLAPTAPSNLTANATDATHVSLQWADNSSNETKFVLQRSLSFTFNILELDVELPANTTSYQDSGLSRLTRYYYRVIAVNDLGTSAPAIAQVDTPQSLPAAPTSAHAFAISLSEIDVQWVDTSDNETGFRLERAEANGPFALLANLPANTQQFADPGRAAGVVYRYRVRAENAVGISDFSSETSSTALPAELTTPVTQLGQLPNGASYPDWFAKAGGKAYFMGTTVTGGPGSWSVTGSQGVWTTDGTEAGTLQVYAGVARDPVEFNGLLYFIGVDALGRPAIFRTDGTVLGTQLIRQFSEEAPGLIPDLLSVAGSYLYFGLGHSNPNDYPGYELWRTDGTPGGTTRASNTYVRVFDASYYATVGDSLYIGAWEGGLLRANDAGASLIPSSTGSSVNHLYSFANLNGSLLFAGPAIGDNALYRFDPATMTQPVLVKETSRYQGGLTGPAIVIGNIGYFTAPTDGHGLEVWRTDGTPEGTYSFTDVVPDSSQNAIIYTLPGAYLLTNVNGVLYFLTHEYGDGTEEIGGGLWKSDGTAAGTVRIRDISPRPSPGIYRSRYALEADGKLVFSDGDYLWRSDGTPEGTIQIDRIGIGDDGERWVGAFYGKAAIALGDKVLFSAAASAGGGSLRVASLTPPPAPTGLSISGSGGGSSGSLVRSLEGDGISLQWLDNSSTESGFVIERSRFADFRLLDKTFFVAANSTSFVDSTGESGVAYFYRVRAANAGGFSAPSNSVAPNKANLPGAWVSGSAWSSNFRNAVTAASLGSIANGVAVDGNSILPWANLDTITLRFASAVPASIAANGVTITLQTSRGIQTIDVLSMTAASTDPNTLVIRLARPLASGRVRVHLTAISGAPLDSNSDFGFRVLVADADRNGVVNATDLVRVRNRVGRSSQQAGAGANAYDALSDLNGDGVVNAIDLVAVRNRVGTTLAAVRFALAPFSDRRIGITDMVRES